MSEEAQRTSVRWVQAERALSTEEAGEDRTEAQGTISVALTQRGVVWVLSAIAASIIVAHVIVTLLRSVLKWPIFGIDSLYTLFGLWAESSLANWYSSTLFLISSALLAVIWVAKRAQRDRYTWHWAGLALIFFALAVDDAADAHGQLSYVMHAHFQTNGFLLYAWIIPAAVAVIVVGLVYARFVWNLDRAIRLRFIVAGALFCGSALIFESIEARYDSLHGTENMPYKILVTIEESIEMGSIILFIATLFAIVRFLGPEVRVRFGSLGDE